MSDDSEWALKRRPDRFYLSKEFPQGTVPDGDPDVARRTRFAYRVFDKGQQLAVATLKGENILRTTESGTQQIKALFYVEDRSIKTLVVQRFSTKDGRPHEASFSLQGDEIEKFLEFVRLIGAVTFSGKERVRIDADDLKQFDVTRGGAIAVGRKNLDVVAELAENEVVARDVIGIAYRRKTLERFRRMLNDSTFFEAERNRLNVGAEAVWQKFFEDNTWIFGYGLYYVFTDKLEGHKLEQVVAGHSIDARGKRVDGLLRTKSPISSLCFVEIKTHETELLEGKPYRPHAWAISREVAGAVAQVQSAIQKAERAFRDRIEPRDADGNRVGDTVYLLKPRSLIVAGSLSQFGNDAEINEPKFTSFELFRRQLHVPEILTFDELFERARFITETEAELRSTSSVQRDDAR